MDICSQTVLDENDGIVVFAMAIGNYLGVVWSRRHGTNLEARNVPTRPCNLGVLRGCPNRVPMSRRTVIAPGFPRNM